jgi:hypothetical protein
VFPLPHPTPPLPTPPGLCVPPPSPHPPTPHPPRVVKLVRALRKGWIKREAAAEKPTVYLIWEDDGEG